MGAETQEVLAALASGKLEPLEGAVAVRDAEPGESDLDRPTLALIKLAAMIAVDAPPVSFAWQVENAIDLGATPEQILDVLRAVASQVGAPKVVAAAPEIMLGLGLPLPGGPE
jgi:alkylhydroperoxidase/carboxymuconolactone decarboxylase family protein YurZ